MIRGPIISAIVSTFNDPEGLTVVLASIAAQTERSVEVLVADNTLDKLAALRNKGITKWFGKRFRYVRTSQANWCLSANILIPGAKGEFLWFPCDDGYYPPRWLQRMTTLKADIIVCDAEWDALGSTWYRGVAAAPRLGDILKGGFLVRRNRMPPKGVFTGPQCHAVAEVLLLEKLVAGGCTWMKPQGLLWMQN